MMTSPSSPSTCRKGSCRHSTETAGRTNRTLSRSLRTEHLVAAAFLGLVKPQVCCLEEFVQGFAIRRRRECLACNGRFTTYERIEETPLRVVKRDGSKEDFERRKILGGLITACQKRPVSTETLESLAADIESQLHEMFDKEVSSKYIGHLVMEALRDVDHVAYVRFASVYREFKDVNEFIDELKPLLDGRRS